MEYPVWLIALEEISDAGGDFAMACLWASMGDISCCCRRKVRRT